MGTAHRATRLADQLTELVLVSDPAGKQQRLQGDGDGPLLTCSRQGQTCGSRRDLRGASGAP